MVSITLTQITIYSVKKRVKSNDNSIRKKERQKVKDKNISKVGSSTTHITHHNHKFA